MIDMFAYFVLSAIEIFVLRWYIRSSVTKVDFSLKDNIIFTLYILIIWITRYWFPNLVLYTLATCVLVMVLKVINWRKLAIRVFFIFVGFSILSDIFSYSMLNLFVSDETGVLLTSNTLYYSTRFIISKLLLIAFLRSYIILKVGGDELEQKLNNYLVLMNLIIVGVVIVLTRISYISGMYNYNQGIVAVGLLGLVLANALLFVLLRDTLGLNKKIKIKEISLVRGKMQIEHFQNEIEKTLEIKKMIHDYNNHLETLNGLIGKEEYSRSKDYIQSLIDEKKDYHDFLLTGNTILDIIINQKKEVMKENNIKFVIDVDKDIDFNIESSHLTSLLTNVLDNAIEATIGLEKKDRFIEIIIKELGSLKSIVVTNTTFVNPITESGLVTSTKKSDLHGLGSKIVKTIVESYGGELKYSFNFNEFKVSIIL